MRPHIAAVRSHAERLGRLYNDKPSDAQIIATLLMSLPPSYDALLVTLDSHAEKDNLEFVIGRLLNEEIRQESEFSTTPFPDTSALAARTFRDKSRVTCFKCRKLGHYQNECPEPGPLVPVAPRADPAAAAAAYARVESFAF
ncbi:hypothetical protein C8R43DRAFT_902369 [Mycena crocata]|nr:hypothetical protein C8R43DRAFT_902369 [Mycena crocata]